MLILFERISREVQAMLVSHEDEIIDSLKENAGKTKINIGLTIREGGRANITFGGTMKRVNDASQIDLRQEPLPLQKL